MLFRNPETTGFGALCQRIAASTTLEVCFSPQRSARAPPPRTLRLTRAAPASDRHHTRHPDQHGGPMRPKPGQHVRCRLDAAAHRAGPDSQPDLHPGESRQSPQPSRSAARLVAPPPLTHARGAATSPGDVHQDSGDGLPRAPRLSRCALSPLLFSATLALDADAGRGAGRVEQARLHRRVLLVDQHRRRAVRVRPRYRCVSRSCLSSFQSRSKADQR